MKRSEINQLVTDASFCFAAHGWALPPNPRWDVTDFGLGDWRSFGLVLVNLAEEPEYCEKLMYAKRGMVTPIHWHQRKKEDIICRWGMLQITVGGELGRSIVVPPMNRSPMVVRVNGESLEFESETIIALQSGERITLTPGIRHAFEPLTDECIIGEVSTANDDLHDNFFENPKIGRFPGIEEDAEPVLRLVSEG